MDINDENIENEETYENMRVIHKYFFIKKNILEKIKNKIDRSIKSYKIYLLSKLDQK